MATNKRFKCPFCDKRLSRKDLVAHIGRVHSDELPEDFTPLRATFHAANRKDFDYRPPCRICKKPTEWDEKKGRYDQICRTKQCHDAYVEKMKVNMGDKLGSNRYTASPEGLEKMLAGRRISGKYKFADGGEKTYTGSYEKKALEFFDKVLHCKSEDVVTPGPVLEYNLDGKRHYYITDIYYVPYDLIIEVKDGGDSPNTNPAFSDTRRKVIAKEKFVIENTNYNYIRLTNNDFSQLLAVFADLKVAFNDSRISGKDPARIVHANEATLVECMIGTIQAAMPMANANDVVVVNYMQNNVFSDKSDIAVADNIKFDRIFKQDKYTGVIEEVDRSFLENCSYSVYRVKDGRHFFDEISNHVGEIQGLDFIYESIFGHKRYTEDQIQYEAEEIQDYYHSLLSIQEEVTDYITEAGVTTAKLEKIKEFNKELNGYDYGVVVKNKPIHDLSSVDTQQYYTISADTFAHHKIGTCWDYVNYEADWFRKNSITYKCYFAIMGQSGKRITPTHTFLTFKDKEGKVYWFESSWGGNQGVREYKDEKELLDDFIDRFTKRRSKWQEVDIYEYRPSGTFVGLNSADFINKITTENKMIKQIFNKNNPVKEASKEVYHEANNNKKDISYSADFNDVKNIVDSLSDVELHNICTGKFVNSPFIVYRKVVLIKNDPAAFLDIYSIPSEMDKDEAVVVCAVKKKYRNKGLIKLCFKGCIESVKKAGINTIYWETDSDNEDSVKLAKSLGFKEYNGNTNNGDVCFYIDTIKKSSNNSHVLYHGSRNKITGYIDPRNDSRENQDYVFATPYKEYALFFAGNPWHDGILNTGTYNDKFYIVELKEGAIKDIFDTKGYIYTVEPSDFTSRNNLEYMSTNKAKIIKSEAIENVYKKILSSDINVYKYPDKPKWWNGHKKGGNPNG